MGFTVERSVFVDLWGLGLRVCLGVDILSIPELKIEVLEGAQKVLEGFWGLRALDFRVSALEGSIFSCWVYQDWFDCFGFERACISV